MFTTKYSLSIIFARLMANRTEDMAKRVTVDLSETAWIKLIERQLADLKQSQKKVSISKLIADIVDEKLGLSNQPAKQ